MNVAIAIAAVNHPAHDVATAPTPTRAVDEVGPPPMAAVDRVAS